MSPDTLAEICARHGIMTTRSEGRWYAGFEPGFGDYRLAIEGTQEAAVCALLKARYGITTRQERARKHLKAGWNAWAMVGETKCNRMDITELAAGALSGGSLPLLGSGA